MSTIAINGVLGNTDKPNSPNVRFNLTTNSQSPSVYGSVQIISENPETGILRGNVSGTSTKMGPNQMLHLNGLIPANDPLNPNLKLPFQAIMVLEAGDKGIGGFNFADMHQEQLPVQYRKEDL
jgi:hypothetical protein